MKFTDLGLETVYSVVKHCFMLNTLHEFFPLSANTPLEIFAVFQPLHSHEFRKPRGLKPHCIQSSRVLVPAGTSKSTLHRHGIQALARVMRTLLML
jgi:hypothetical protein